MKRIKSLVLFVLCMMAFAAGCSDENSVTNTATGNDPVQTDDIELISIFVQYQETPFPNPPDPEEGATVKIFNSAGTTLLWQGTTGKSGYTSVTSGNSAFQFVYGDTYLITASTYYNGNLMHYAVMQFDYTGPHMFLRVITYPA